MIVGFQLANSYGENGNIENFSFTIYKERVPKKSWKIPLMKGRGGTQQGPIFRKFIRFGNVTRPLAMGGGKLVLLRAEQ